jgi:hypothetical protein
VAAIHRESKLNGEVESALEVFAHLPANAERDALRISAAQALTALSRQCKELQEAANGYPTNPIRMDIWHDGVTLGVLAHTLALQLRQRGLTEMEEQAHAFCCVAVCAVQPHDHHIVGPAMLARAECNERLGNTGVAVQLYQAVVADLSALVEAWETRAAALSAEDEVALRCLVHAIERLLVLQPGANATALLPLRARCRQLVPTPHAQQPPVMNGQSVLDRYRLIPYLQAETQALQHEFPQVAIRLSSSISSTKTARDPTCSVLIECNFDLPTPVPTLADTVYLELAVTNMETTPRLDEARVYWNGTDYVCYGNGTELALIDQPTQYSLAQFEAELPRLVEALRTALRRGSPHTAEEQELIAQTLAVLDATLAAHGFGARYPYSSLKEWIKRGEADHNQWCWSNQKSRAELGFAGVYVRTPTGRELDFYFLFPPEDGRIIIIPFPADATQETDARINEFVARFHREVLQVIASAKAAM